MAKQEREFRKAQRAERKQERREARLALKGAYERHDPRTLRPDIRLPLRSAHQPPSWEPGNPQVET
jgi:hypothetical protein